MAAVDEKFTLTTGPVDNLKALLEEIDIFWFRLGYKIDKTILSEKSQCRFLVTPVTGIDHIDEELCKELGIQIICLRGEKEFLKEVRATAEHTLLLAMMLMRHAVPAVQDVYQENWRRDLFRGFELYQKKVGIVGYGRLGKIVSEYFLALGCEVGIYDPYQTSDNSRINTFTSLKDCILNSDIISLHLTYNSETHHLFDQNVLQYFSGTKWLINTSRGGIVDDIALLNVLKSGKLSGAAIDVVYGEPNVTNNPLIAYAKENRNLIITPHIGGCTYESFEKTELFIFSKLTSRINNE